MASTEPKVETQETIPDQKEDSTVDSTATSTTEGETQDKNKEENQEQDVQKKGNESDSEGEEIEIPIGNSSLADLLQRLMGLGLVSQTEPQEQTMLTIDGLPELTLKGISEYIKNKQPKNIIVMTGAGISVSAGIPDFRTPGTGLYSQLEKYNLPQAEAVFDIKFFRSNPKPFYTLAKELYPDNFKPTPAHLFVRLLHEKGLLLRQFTQNIDTLELSAGLPAEKVVFAHGGFGSNHCINCKHAYSVDWIRTKIFSDEIPKCEECQGLVKPDIVFFGEPLPRRFFRLHEEDFPKCDLLIVMGTSLTVQPFASLISDPPETCPRLLINLNKVGGAGWMEPKGFRWNENNYRDVMQEDYCDSGVQKLVDLLGWSSEFEELLKQFGHSKEKKADL